MNPSTTKDRVLVIDDDIELCDLVIEYLTAEGFQVERGGHVGRDAVSYREAGGWDGGDLRER